MAKLNKAAGNALEKLYVALDQSESADKNAIDIAEDGIRKAKDLGADDVIKELKNSYAKEDLQKVTSI